MMEEPWVTESVIPDITMRIESHRRVLTQTGSVFELSLEVELITANGSTRTVTRTILGIELADHDAEIFVLLANGWTATHTVGREFRINNGPSEDLSIIERLMTAGLVNKDSARTFVAAVYPLEIASLSAYLNLENVCAPCFEAWFQALIKTEWKDILDHPVDLKFRDAGWIKSYI